MHRRHGPLSALASLPPNTALHRTPATASLSPVSFQTLGGLSRRSGLQIASRVALGIILAFNSRIFAQSPPGFPTPEGIRELRVARIDGTIPIYRSRGVTKAEAADLQVLMTACVAKYHSALRKPPKVELAILDPGAWKRVSGLPYGLPHHNAAVSPAVVLVPTTAPTMFGNVGVRPDRLDRFFHLLALHELGHVLMYAIVDVDPATAWDQGHFPEWYPEFTANYIGLSCLSDRPAEARLFRGSEASLRASPRPSFTGLDDFPKVLTMQTGEGAPYALTSIGAAHFAWYQRLVTEAAGRVQKRLGAGFVPLLRTQWSRQRPVTTADIIKDLSESNPGLASWLQSFGAIP